MRLAKLCITLALALGGWHEALAAALCARDPGCHAAASPRGAHAPGHAQAASDPTPSHTTRGTADDQHQATTAAADPTNRRGHCGTPSESRGAVVHATRLDAESETAHDNSENASSESVSSLRAPASSCEHCVGRQTDQPARVKPVAYGHARDSHAAPAPTQHPITLPQSAPRPRFAPTQHAPPRGRPLHLLNSALLI